MVLHSLHAAIAAQLSIQSHARYDEFSRFQVVRSKIVIALASLEMSEAEIRLHVEPLEEGGFVGTSPDVPGLVVEGRNLVEVAELAQELTRTIVETYLDHGDPLPLALVHL